MSRLLCDTDLKDRMSEYCLSEDEYRRMCDIIDDTPSVEEVLYERNGKE